jgi:hypothetical protein
VQLSRRQEPSDDQWTGRARDALHALRIGVPGPPPTQARPDSRGHLHHPAGRIQRIDPLAQRPKHDPTLSKLADRSHDLSSIAAQAVDTDDNNGIAFACVIEQCSKAGTLLTGERARELVAIDVASIDACRRKCIDLLVEGLMPGADTGTSRSENRPATTPDPRRSGLSV